MKLILITLFFSLGAMAAETTTPAAAAPTSPKQVCDALAKAAAEDNFKAFEEWTAMPGMHCDGGKACTEKNCTMHKQGKGKGKNKDMMADGHCEDMKGMHGMHDMAEMKGMMDEKGFHEMHTKEMAKLKTLACKDEKIVGDHAWVEATTGGTEARLVPFKMVEGKWKFDMHTYHAFYHHDMMKETK